MTSDARAPRSVRTVFVADHLWEVLQTMAQEMGVVPDDLVNQALFTWARLNGYAVPSQLGLQPQPSAPARARRPTPTPAPARRPSALTTQPLESYPPEAPTDAPEEALDEEPLGDSPLQVEDPAADDAYAQDAAEDLPPAADPSDSGRVNRLIDDALSELPSDDVEDAGGSSPPVLYVSADGGAPVVVAGARFLVGRGKHCDLIIDSNRVSREHAAISLEGDQYVMEDLNSSNGTWFNRERVTRRAIEEGDTFTLGAVSLRCSFEPSDDQPAA